MPARSARAQMVTEWLESLHLEQYADLFAAAGYDDPEAIPSLDDADLDTMRITLPGHRKRLLLNAKKYKASENVKKMAETQSSQRSSRAFAAELNLKLKGPEDKDAPPEPEAEPEEKEETVYIVNEMEILREMKIVQSDTASKVISEYQTQFKMSVPPGKCYLLYEVLDPPGVRRPLQDDEKVLDVKDAWPSGGEGCSFLIRSVDAAAVKSASVTMTGTIEKRGGSKGNARNWKTRHFEIKTLLQYHKSAPKDDTQEPLGAWSYTDSEAYEVTYEMKKAKKPLLCFCLKPKNTPWGDDPKDRRTMLEDNCRFMSASTEEERIAWIRSVQAAAKKATQVVKEEATTAAAATEEKDGGGSSADDAGADEGSDPKAGGWKMP